MKRAFLFPGQGSQVVGMGKDIYEKYEEARKIYDETERISGIDVKKICFEGPEDILNKTEFTQIAILTTSLAFAKILESKGIKAEFALGLSLGEYTALIYSGILSFEDGINLIKKRGYYMGNLLPKEEYQMSAIIGLDSSKIEEVCKKVEEEGIFVVPANYNCKVQTVISGTKEGIEKAGELLKEAGAKRVIPLNTSGPFHTVKLEEASRAFAKELEMIEFKEGNVKVIKNIDGSYYNSQDDIRKILEKHIISPVRLDKAIEKLRRRKSR